MPLLEPVFVSDSLVPPEEPPIVRHQLGGQRAERLRALIDDVIAVGILHACQLDGFAARDGFSGDPNTQHILSQAYQLRAVVISPMTQCGT